MKNILITGCSRGIGFETVKSFSQISNVSIFAVSRNMKGLQKLKDQCKRINKQSIIHILEIDLSNLDSVSNIISYLKSHLNGKLDGIIHNAGFLVKKDFGKLSLEDLNNSFNINCFAPFCFNTKIDSFF